MGMIARQAVKKTHVYANGAACSRTTAKGTKMKSQLMLMGTFLAPTSCREPVNGQPRTETIPSQSKIAAVHVLDQRAQVLGQKSAGVSVEAQGELGPLKQQLLEPVEGDPHDGAGLSGTRGS